MEIDLAKGIIKEVTYYPSPNCDFRSNPEDIDLLVIHGISLPPGEFGGTEITDFFLNHLDVNAHAYFAEIIHLKVSSHLLIHRDGQIIQYVPFHLRAWHAGQSSFQGREKCNDFSIGIELEGTDTLPYTEAQYQTLSKVSLMLLRTYPLITLDRIVGHSDIAPGRKTDPGAAFDWSYYRALLTKEMAT